MPCASNFAETWSVVRWLALCTVTCAWVATATRLRDVPRRAHRKAAGGPPARGARSSGQRRQVHLLLLLRMLLLLWPWRLLLLEKKICT